MGVARRAEPTSMEEFRRRSEQGNRFSGTGADLARHIPCPFCAAPCFRSIKVCDIPDAAKLTDEATCTACDRSARIASLGVHRVVWIQTGGDDPPSWLVPRISRITVDRS